MNKQQQQGRSMTIGAKYKRGRLLYSPWHSDIRTSNRLNSNRIDMNPVPLAWAMMGYSHLLLSPAPCLHFLQYKPHDGDANSLFRNSRDFTLRSPIPPRVHIESPPVRFHRIFLVLTTVIWWLNVHSSECYWELSNTIQSALVNSAGLSQLTLPIEFTCLR